MCKPFPPPLVRGGVFLVGLGTKYRDIADGNVIFVDIDFHVSVVVGNQVPRYSGWKQVPLVLQSVFVALLGTKYRDIADGNVFVSVAGVMSGSLGTKYRDIADGNRRAALTALRESSWEPSTAI